MEILRGFGYLDAVCILKGLQSSFRLLQSSAQDRNGLFSVLEEGGERMFRQLVLGGTAGFLGSVWRV